MRLDEAIEIMGALVAGAHVDRGEAEEALDLIKDALP